MDIRGLTPSCRLVLLTIANYVQKDGSPSWASQQTIASRCELSERQVRHYIRKLKDLGHLKQRGWHGRHKTALYTLSDGILTPHRKLKVVTVAESGTSHRQSTSYNPSKNQLEPIRKIQVIDRFSDKVVNLEPEELDSTNHPRRSTETNEQFNARIRRYNTKRR